LPYPLDGGLVALYGPLIIYMPLTEVQGTIVNAIKDIANSQPLHAEQQLELNKV
jgi:hypothetical protein